MNIDRSNSLSHSSEEHVQWGIDINDNAVMFFEKIIKLFKSILKHYKNYFIKLFIFLLYFKFHWEVTKDIEMIWTALDLIVYHKFTKFMWISINNEISYRSDRLYNNIVTANLPSNFIRNKIRLWTIRLHIK